MVDDRVPGDGPPVWHTYQCPRRGCDKARRATTAPPCPVHPNVLMKRVRGR